MNPKHSVRLVNKKCDMKCCPVKPLLIWIINWSLALLLLSPAGTELCGNGHIPRLGSKCRGPFKTVVPSDMHNLGIVRYVHEK